MSSNQILLNAPTHAPTVVRDAGVDQFDNNDASSEASDGANLRVRNFLKLFSKSLHLSQDDLEAVLQADFNFQGKFAFKETFDSTPLPGLHINGIGLIAFPLTERDAKLIEAVATQAPFGKGTETVVDTTVRNTLEINPRDFSFTNPDWKLFLQTVINKVARGLGLPQNLPPPRADLYKLLLYKSGSQSVHPSSLYYMSPPLTFLQFPTPQGVRAPYNHRPSYTSNYPLVPKSPEACSLHLSSSFPQNSRVAKYMSPMATKRTYSTYPLPPNSRPLPSPGIRT